MSHELPEPDSPELLELLTGEEHRVIYAFLYNRQNDPPTMTEIRDHVTQHYGEPRSQTDRRVRDLRRTFVIDVARNGANFYYKLAGIPDIRHDDPLPQISLKTRAMVLSPGRCALCGRTPLDHRVELVVDHKIPQAWGGSDEPENLQPLCVDCNAGKKHWYAAQDVNDEQIRAAINWDEPQRRIGELLKAFEGVPVPGELIGIVASAKTYQEDWQKRLRELRVLGWKIRAVRERTPQRTITYYALDHWEPWPDGSLIQAIRTAEKTKKTARKRSVE